MVVKISNVPLSESEIKLLSRDLSFGLKPSRIDQFQLKEDVKQFSRRLKLKEFFYNQDDTNNNKINPFKRNSNWTPPINRESSLDTYIKSVGREIQHWLDRGPSHCSNDNITKEERKALSSLRKGTDIIIKPADKGSATVVMCKDDYLTRVMSHLDNTQF